MKRYSRSWPVTRNCVFDALRCVGRRPQNGGVTVTHMNRHSMKFHVKLPYPRSGPPPCRADLTAHIKCALNNAPILFQIAYRKHYIAVWFTVTERRWIAPVVSNELSIRTV